MGNKPLRTANAIFQHVHTLRIESGVKSVYSEELKRHMDDFVGFRGYKQSAGVLQKSLELWVIDSPHVWCEVGKTEDYISHRDFEHVGGTIKFKGKQAEIKDRDQLDELAAHIQAYIAEEYAARVTDMHKIFTHFK